MNILKTFGNKFNCDITPELLSIVKFQLMTIQVIFRLRHCN